MNQRLTSWLGVVFLPVVVVGCDGGTAADVPASEEGVQESALAPAKKVLDFDWFGQENGYFCGPAATRMVLGASMQQPPSQSDIASFMGTTVNGTDYIGQPVRALNRWLAPPTAFRTRPIDWNPTPTQRALLKEDLLARIDSGFGIVANVVMLEGGWRPPGYPPGLIGHYVALVGYDEGGDKVLVADPAAEGAAGPAWRDVPRTYWLSLADVAFWIGGKGYSG